MSSETSWKGLFENWPETIERKGLITTTFDEQIPFVNFMISGNILLLERDKPDSFGARKVMVIYDAIAAVKITSPIELARFQVMGFQAPQ